MITPNTNVLQSLEYADVYPPSEDSFLFLDALEDDTPFINRLPITVSLEMGSGSGILSSFFYAIYPRLRYHLCIDLSSAACRATGEVIRSNISLQCSLAGPVLPRLLSNVDLILFNPPYVPTTSEEHQAANNTVAATWSGGWYGREVSGSAFPTSNTALVEHYSQLAHLISLIRMVEERDNRILSIYFCVVNETRFATKMLYSH
ncbi:unnamed protein product [Echinostoma caproni]|uniref:MTS domain-containing protein n=1 Tax=Echinostoma caproni TaxID=27848 RepID=A0A183BCR8_9TREM|nr:unnamed protein product [Echinostoma caproni]